MSSVFKRFDVAAHTYGEGNLAVYRVFDAEGEYVFAQDAYDRVAVLEAEISTLKTMLKDARKDATSYKPAGAAINGQILYTKHN